jgi:hypothetical protein
VSRVGGRGYAYNRSQADGTTSAHLPERYDQHGQRSGADDRTGRPVLNISFA